MSHTPIANLLKIGEDKSGNIGILFGMFIALTATTVGAMTDFGRALTERAEMQAALDAAAIAGARVIGDSEDACRAAAIKAFAANFKALSDTPVQPTIKFDGDNIAVTAQSAVPTTFTKLAGVGNVEVEATSTALGQGGGRACMLALNETDSDSLHLQGNNKLIAEGCVVHVNSAHSESIDAVDNAAASADAFCTAGGTSGESHFSPSPINGCGKVKLGEPFTSMAAPYSDGCDHNNMSVKKQDGPTVIWPGVYCGGLDIRTHAEVFAIPGEYVMKNGPLAVASQATLTGWNVMFYFTGNNTTLEVMSGADVELTAPSSGPYENFLFIQDPDSNPGVTTKIQGGGRVEMSGILYTPTWIVEVGGNGAINEEADHWSMVADSFYMIGNAEIYVKSNAETDDLLPVSPRKTFLVN